MTVKFGLTVRGKVLPAWQVACIRELLTVAGAGQGLRTSSFALHSGSCGAEFSMRPGSVCGRFIMARGGVSGAPSGLGKVVHGEPSPIPTGREMSCSSRAPGSVASPQKGLLARPAGLPGLVVTVVDGGSGVVIRTGIGAAAGRVVVVSTGRQKNENQHRGDGCLPKFHGRCPFRGHVARTR